MRRLGLNCLIAAGLAIGLASAVAGQDTTGGKFQLPSDPAQWVNSAPISLEALEGKAAVLWFFEESCPSCREKWPPLMSLATSYAGKPIMFIGVNSGNSRADVEHYARGVGCNWPIIVDASREFEKQCDVGEISLKNIYQVGFIDSRGRFRRGSWQDLKGTFETALEGAKWKVDPAGVPAALRSAWTAVEFGNPGPAGATIRKSMASSNRELKEAATKLNEVVQADIQARISEAKAAASSGEKWKAYKGYDLVVTHYGSYDLPADVRSAVKELATDEGVKKQLTAQKSLDTVMRLMQSNSATTRKSGLARLKKLAQDSAGTDAAVEAERLLSQLAESL